MAWMSVGLPSCLLLSFLVFAYLLLRLRTLSVDANGIRGSLLFYLLVVVFAVVVRLFLFLVVRLLLRLRMSTVERQKIRGSFTFGAFV